MSAVLRIVAVVQKGVDAEEDGNSEPDEKGERKQKTEKSVGIELRSFAGAPIAREAQRAARIVGEAAGPPHTRGGSGKLTKSTSRKMHFLRH